MFPEILHLHANLDLCLFCAKKESDSFYPFTLCGHIVFLNAEKVFSSPVFQHRWTLKNSAHYVDNLLVWLDSQRS